MSPLRRGAAAVSFQFGRRRSSVGTARQMGTSPAMQQAMRRQHAPAPHGVGCRVAGVVARAGVGHLDDDGLAPGVVARAGPAAEAAAGRAARGAVDAHHLVALAALVLRAGGGAYGDTRHDAALNLTLLAAGRTVLPDPAQLTAVTYFGPSIFIMLQEQERAQCAARCERRGPWLTSFLCSDCCGWRRLRRSGSRALCAGRGRRSQPPSHDAAPPPGAFSSLRCAVRSSAGAMPPKRRAGGRWSGAARAHVRRWPASRADAPARRPIGGRKRSDALSDQCRADAAPDARAARRIHAV